MSLIDALPSPSFKRRPWHPNVVLLCLSGAMLAAAWLLSFVSVAPNRIVSGTAFGMVDAISWPGAALVSLLFTAMAALSSVPTPRHYRAMLGIIILTLLLMPFGLMVAGHWLVDPSLPQARLGIGAAYWTVLFVLLLCLVELRLRLGLSRWWPTLLLAGVGIAWWGCAALWPASGRVCP